MSGCETAFSARRLLRSSYNGTAGQFEQVLHPPLSRPRDRPLRQQLRERSPAVLNDGSVVHSAGRLSPVGESWLAEPWV